MPQISTYTRRDNNQQRIVRYSIYGNESKSFFICHDRQKLGGLLVRIAPGSLSFCTRKYQVVDDSSQCLVIKSYQDFRRGREREREREIERVIEKSCHGRNNRCFSFIGKAILGLCVLLCLQGKSVPTR